MITSLPLSIPSPPQAVWHLGPLPIRAYSLAILTGIFLAIWLGRRRWVQRNGDGELLYDVAIIAVPMGIIGGRLYHVITSPDAYFGANGDPWGALRIWEGGLGILGAVILGGLTVGIFLHYRGTRIGPFLDALAPGVLFAQAIGRLGNWFNQELYGGPTTLPWGLQISPAHQPFGDVPGTLYHPTFLYELLWNVAGATLLIWLSKKFKLASGQVFWAYLIVYPLGRTWIEMVRIDESKVFFDIRLNVWVFLIVLIIGIIGFVIAGKRGNNAVLQPGEPGYLSADQGEDHDENDTEVKETAAKQNETVEGSTVGVCEEPK